MALRPRINQQTDFSRFTAKSALLDPVSAIQKRPALGEIGNKLPSFRTNIRVSKNGALPERKITLRPKPPVQDEHPKKATSPSQIVVKKTTTIAPPLKETKTILDKTVAKQDLKSQKSILNQVDEEERKAVTNDNPESYSSKQLDVIDPDGGSKEPAMVSEYVVDIFIYMRSMETKFPIRKNFLKGHSTAPWMRATLIDWLAGVHSHFSLCIETLHLCVAIVDRYLQDNKDVGRHTLQLVGISSLLIAAKYEEMCIPSIIEFVDICSHTFSKRQILAMERTIINQLDYSFGRPLSLHFLRRYNKVAKVRSEHHSLGKLVLELALLKYEVSHIPPSLIAAAACCLSMGILDEVEDIKDLPKLWTPTLVHYTTYEYSDFEDVLVILSNILVENESSKFQRIRRKYAVDSRLEGPLMRQLTSTISSDRVCNLLDRIL